MRPGDVQEVHGRANLTSGGVSGQFKSHLGRQVHLALPFDRHLSAPHLADTFCT